MRENILQSFGILLFSVFLALMTNHFRLDGLPLSASEITAISNSSQNEMGEELISFEEFCEKLKQPDIIIFDARSAEAFSEGHIPGAKSFPFIDILKDRTLMPREISFDSEIIVHCEGPNCSLAEDAAVFLREAGYENVKVFLGGWEEWVDNKMPVHKKRDS